MFSKSNSSLWTNWHSFIPYRFFLRSTYPLSRCENISQLQTWMNPKGTDEEQIWKCEKWNTEINRKSTKESELSCEYLRSPIQKRAGGTLQLRIHEQGAERTLSNDGIWSQGYCCVCRFEWIVPWSNWILHSNWLLPRTDIFFFNS